MPTENNSKKSVKPRESGHYWVKWSGIIAGLDASPIVWRMGAYHTDKGWKLPGDERLYQDGDFIEINENRIPFTKGRLYTNRFYWVAVVAYLTATILYIITIYKKTIR